MERRSVFFDEWIKSLREQYKYVIQNNDNVTLPSLTKVLHDVGFTDDELTHLRVEATMHIDEVSEDFVPDLQVLDKHQAGQPHPSECTCPQCIPIDESQFDGEGQLLIHDDPEEASHETGHVFAVAKIEEPVQEPIDEVLEKATEPIDELETFEDSLIEEESDDAIEEEILDEDDPEDDPDAPKQISMF